MSETTAPELNNIQVDVHSEYLPEQSNPEEQRYVHAYHITITNDGQQSAQLLNRHWYIIDANDDTQEVQGEGVIGQQPTLQPGESYQYTSGTIIKTEFGCMHGYYEMQDTDGELFKADIPAFTLALPNSLN